MYGNLDKRLKTIEQAIPPYDRNHEPVIYINGEDDSYISDEDKKQLMAMVKAKKSISFNIEIGEYIEENN